MNRINYHTIKRHEDVPFDQYLKFKGYSHSFLKSEINGVASDFVSSDKVRLGSMVDAILTAPDEVDFLAYNYNIAKVFAHKIRSEWGECIKLFKSQISYTATAEFCGFEIPVTGRLDWLLEDIAVVDLKVTHEKNVKSLIKHMGYENQMFNYCKMAKVNVAYIMVYSVPLNEVIIHKVDCSGSNNKFWEEKIIKFGKIRNDG